VIPAIGHLIYGRFRQVGKEHLQVAGITRRDMLHTGHNEPHGRSEMIKFLDGQDHHRAAVLMRGPLLDCRHSRIKLSLPSATAPHRNRQIHFSINVIASSRLLRETEIMRSKPPPPH
jgi:hypothetical protein